MDTGIRAVLGQAGILALALFSAAALAEGAGTVIHLSGTLSVQRPDGSVRVLAQKSEVHPGDVLTTQRDSYAQINFTDGSSLTMRPNTEIRLERYHFVQNRPQDDRTFLRLVRGSMRTVTGLVGKRGNPDAYQIGTRSLARLTALDLMDVARLDRLPASRPAPPRPDPPIPVPAAEEFAEIFDGFSIGSNDLTQLVLGLDRDSEIVARLFDERNLAVTRTIAHAIAAAKTAGRKIGICGQAPSDYPDFAKFLVEQGIDSISLSEDAVIQTLLLVAKVEQEVAEKHTSVKK